MPFVRATIVAAALALYASTATSLSVVSDGSPSASPHTRLVTFAPESDNAPINEALDVGGEILSQNTKLVDEVFESTFDAQARLSLPDGVAEAGPTVTLDRAVFTGKRVGKSNHFLGIPYVYPPTGDRRFRLPKPLPPYTGDRDATRFGFSCPQEPMSFPRSASDSLKRAVNSVLDDLTSDMTPDSEDCLTVNVITPPDANPGSGLPVLVWIFGGGFEIGSASTYNGGSVVDRSIDLQQPVIFVSMNYRMTAFGFLPGKEVKEEGVGNLGLQDQRAALRWVQKYIKNFGGDPTKVTLWGQGSGAISTSLQMITNDGDTEGLFRAAIMQSGGPIPVGNIENGQEHYDALVSATWCDRERDTLQCLRDLPYWKLKNAVDRSPNFLGYQGLVLPWLPRVDGVFLKAPPQQLVLQGRVANLPMITGNCEDEGSIFSISSVNLTTTKDVHTYLKSFMLPSATDAEIDTLLRHYPDNDILGCPFDTGRRNAIGPQYKRVAAIEGDVMLHGPRRFFLENLAEKQSSWTFISKRLKATPFLGSAHATDIRQSFGNGEMKDYFIRFANNLDPNGQRGLGIPWPRYDARSRKTLSFQDSLLFPVSITQDNYRVEPLEFVANLSLSYPL